MKEYLTTQQIADRLDLERKYVTDKVVKRPEFPKPAIKLSQKTRKWLRDDFEHWLAAHYYQ